jgi:hypothetical protein
VETGATGMNPLARPVHFPAPSPDPRRKGRDHDPLMDGLTTTGRPRPSCWMKDARKAALSVLLLILVMLGV